MPKPELVLSNATTFFSGRLENVFKKAKKHGFKYLEILPYRWTTPEEILALEKKYQIQVVGIHLPQWWSGSLRQIIKKQSKIYEQLLSLAGDLFVGSVVKNPSLKIAEILKKQNRDFYLLFHANLVWQARSEFLKLTKQFAAAIENIPYHKKYPLVYWDPLKIKEAYPAIQIAFDIGHFETVPNFASKLLETYAQIKPAIIHISYGNFPPHILPNQKQQAELKEMLQIHQPKYIVLETNPLVSVKRGKKFLEKIIESTPT